MTHILDGKQICGEMARLMDVDPSSVSVSWYYDAYLGCRFRVTVGAFHSETISFKSSDLAMNLDQFSARFLAPAAYNIKRVKDRQ